MRAPAWLMCCAIALTACASSRPQQDCDPSTMSCVGDDAAVLPPADAAPDGPPLKDFGEACTDNGQCDSRLCILVGPSGQCTKLCGECPDGYGCLGVQGIEIEGQVSFVCVPTSNQLCTPCTQDTECTLIGMDKCVTYPDGDQACARDCSGVTCPTGYECESVTIGGASFQQCMASSGACDCTAANPSAMQPCNIVTPWNVCLGAQTCGGASGWSSCEPPSPNDDPDPAFADSNCDGLDGDMARAIFVSLGGVNSATCGLLFNDPCQTIGFGISRAVQASRPHVYVQSGTYTASITMVNGISVFGGYNFNWKRAPYSMGGHTVTIVGGVTAVRFDAITQPTWLDNLIIRSANASGVGASSIGVLITASQQVELRGVLVEPGAGTAGTDGASGTTGASGLNGGPGNPGCEDSSGVTCSTCTRPAGGTPGGSTCGRAGGVGGQPGSGGGGGSPGGTGTGGTPGGPGAGCGGAPTCDGQVGTNGGVGTAGSSGTAGANFGSLNGFTYVTANGGVGTNGNPGNGGGGGGGGGGGDDVCNSYGSSGGGGGAGGCGGTRGFGGTGGGGSFGVIALDSQAVISGSLVTAGNGGNGGRGGGGGGFGAGGIGGPGGAYGGGSEQDDGGDGAAGGNGARGGAGGAGGGGGGGPSVAVVCLGASTTTLSVVGSTLNGGNGGTGGTSAAPGAPGFSAPTFGCPI